MATVAESLRNARETAKLSVKQVADATKIRTDHIRALEAGTYDVFVAPVYIRGFVRTLCRLYRLPEAEVLATLESELRQTEKFAEHPSLTRQPKGFLDGLTLLLSRVNWKIVIPALGVVILLLAAIGVERFLRERRAKDPLAGIGPGLYVPDARRSGETLSLPPPTSATNQPRSGTR
ncbi:MAG: helix-turn-helix domain-containing protein [Verrucomicrobia bacterium]|nr:helix-turn-helix domain-containing protein [Verrucomicrobiota bacterium]